jgi:L,D-transpeptidase YcbB
MLSKRTGTVAAMAWLLAAGTIAVPQGPASAQTLLDFIMGGPGAVQRNAERRGSPLDSGQVTQQPSSVDQLRAWEASQRQAEPEPVVVGPKYYTYKVDELVRVDFSKLADPVVTGSISEGGDQQPINAFAQASRHLSDVQVRALAEVGKAVTAFYGENAGFVWTDKNGPNARAEAALAVFAKADRVGLSPADYLVEWPAPAASSAVTSQATAARSGASEAGASRSDASQAAAPNPDRARLQFEMEMAAAVASYMLDATRGRIAPNRISGYHDFDRKEVDLVAGLKVAARTANITSYLERRSPTHAKFQALQAEYDRLIAEDADVDRVEIAEGTLVRPGSSNPELTKIIAAIRERGSDALKTTHSLTFADYQGSPVYDTALVELVKDFQKESGLMDDGIIGRNTIVKLTGVSNARKIEAVQLSMERLRWINRDLGERHVMINAPAFKVSYVEDGREALEMRAVVGTKANQTYFFQDEIQTVELNPYWGVPRSIIVNEMLPKLRQDPGYLDRIGYEVTTQGGTQVASSSINWYGVGANVPYNVRQPPGSTNALGELKIMFPNEHAIYMHDTPAKDLFGRDTRAYSHGCVRLEDPRAMAAAVLGTDKADIGSQIADGRNKVLKVEANIPVYIAYFTAWPNAEGKVEYFDDVYERDMYLGRAITATNQARNADS